MKIARLLPANLPCWLNRCRRPFHSNYLAFYSSWYGGIVTDPLLMMAPIDDHMVHRGDAVFEGFRCVSGALFNYEAHLRRLDASASAIGLVCPVSRKRLTEIVSATVRAGGERNCLIRLYLSRGPGSLTVNPYDCTAPQLYILITGDSPGPMERHPEGISLSQSTVPPKPAFYARIKNCNYLPNALMKKEAVEAGAHFAVGFDERGYLAEGATENIGLVTHDKRLFFPCLDNILNGTTMQRVVALAKQLVRKKILKEAGFRDIPRKMLAQAAEILVCSTTADVSAAVMLNKKKVGTGKPGPIYKLLHDLLLDDLQNNQTLRTPIFGRLHATKATGRKPCKQKKC